MFDLWRCTYMIIHAHISICKSQEIEWTGNMVCTWGAYAKIAIGSSSPTPFRKGVHIPLKRKIIDSHVPNRKGYVTWEGNPFTLQGTNIFPKNAILKMIFLFPRWDMLIPWRVTHFVYFLSKSNMKLFWEALIFFVTSAGWGPFKATRISPVQGVPARACTIFPSAKIYKNISKFWSLEPLPKLGI